MSRVEIMKKTGYNIFTKHRNYIILYTLHKMFTFIRYKKEGSDTNTKSNRKIEILSKYLAKKCTFEYNKNRNENVSSYIDKCMFSG